jgi:threonine/homoserine/homoserine lactone efflux protein
MSIEFLITTLIIVATPGTGAIYTLAAGLGQGARASVIAAFGCTIAVVFHMVLAVSGVAAIMHSSAVAFQSLKYAGVAYLLYMAWSTFRHGGGLVVEEGAPAKSAWTLISRGVLLNLLNPKLTIFFFAFLPQFVPSGTNNALPLMLELSTVFTVLTFVVFAIYGVMAAGLRDRVLTRPRVMRWLQRVFAGSFLALGARLALQQK